ncbi:rapamycin-insensitive companion of mTOR isoform X2 [Ooceraea biroi]|uniref:rapamycin-insensitive companion of mTOR isoform X2 n=1 Tax=Ooceraea biroi TaxID=2015173 RepID=UPI0005BDE827|nr:rapamycin-insensitive companion of mTOR isoform X2 [Ooceraea biroi]
MAISSWMFWGRSLRTGRSHRSRQDTEDNCVQLDLSRGLKENVKEILTNLCQRHNVPSVKKLAYLNAIVKLISENDSQDYGYSAEDLFCCLRVVLVHEATQVRAAALRAVRYMLKKEQDVIAINKLQYPYFLARSMDVNLRNEMERMQALRLVRRILVLAPKHFSPALARSLVSLTNGGIEERDRAFRTFLATLCELGVLNSNLLISCGGVGALSRAAMTGQSATTVESIVGVLLRLLNNPDTRNSVSLLCFAAPYCELHSLSMERTKEERERRFAASKLALLSILRSYPGILHFCRPDNNSGLKAIADILYVEQLEVRGAVLELLYELLDLPLPTWTDEPDVALAAVDPSRSRDSWKLSEGFVAAEGKFILPSLSSHCPNITEIHSALLVYVLLECGLHRALAETIVSSDTFISVRAAVLLGALLHLAHSLLPSELCDLTPPLPNLLEHASTGKHQALAAVTILERMHTMMRRRPTPASLFLDRILQAGTWLRPTVPRRQRPSGRHWLRIGRESPISPLLKDAQVLSSKDALAWNWPVVRAILRSREDTTRILHDSDHRLFMKRLVRYFKPSWNGYSRVELGTNATLAREATLAGCDLLNCLLELHEPEGARLLNELIGDIAEQIGNIFTAETAHDCLFSPRHMSTTCCQKYFLFLGQLSHSAKGTVILKSFNLLEKLQDLALATNHDCYVKLIVSSLDYTREGPNRKMLNKIISEASLWSTRLYATQFLRLILRARMTDAVHWAMALLADRLSDSSTAVALAALEALHEACEETEYLKVFLQQGGQQSRDWDKWLEHLGDKGYLLKIRLYSLQQGFASLAAPSEELEKWIGPGGFAERYVGLIEEEIHDALTRRQRDETGSYQRRTTNIPMVPRDIFVPPHLIGQLAQHDLGIQLLLRRNVIQRFARVLQRFKLEFGGRDSESNSRCTRASRLTAAAVTASSTTAEDAYVASEESGTEGEAVEQYSRLETILDAEIIEGEIRGDAPCQLRAESLMEIRRKTSVDDSRHTTPERSWRMETADLSRDDYSMGPNGGILKVKSALWALGHAGTSVAGVEHLNHLGIIEMITSMAETCPYYSVRATAMYALNLIATTRAGADALINFNWPCVRHRRGDNWPVVPPSARYPVPSPVPVQRHHRSLSDGKPELPEPIARRTRNRSESAATDLEARRYVLPERGETPSPVSSIQRLSQQDAEGYARLRSLQRHRRPSYSQSSLEMYSLDGRLSLQSLSEYDSSRSWFAENVILTPTPPPPEKDNENLFYIGICLPRRLLAIFPEPPQPAQPSILEDIIRAELETTEIDEESSSEYDADTEHCRACLVCYHGKSKDSGTEQDMKLRRDILRYTQRLANPVWYRHSRQALLRLRQRYPERFQDTCLFSDVAARLSSCTYRMPARRFLQELFLDSPFEALYTEPVHILKIPIGTEEIPLQSPVPSSEASSRQQPASPAEGKINGRLTLTEIQTAQLASVAEESTASGNSCNTAHQCKKKPQEALRSAQERRSDEKIIAEILKPEERIRLSKSSDRSLKVSVRLVPDS